MYKTIEAVYENGELIPVNGSLPKKKSWVLVTIIGTAKPSARSMHLSGFLSRKGMLKHIKGNPVAIQRKLRDAW